jgi:hypothetical protein
MDASQIATAHRVAVELIQQTMTGADGYAARDVLAHPGCVSLLTARQADGLSDLVEVCALGKGAMPGGLLTDLSHALDTSEATLVCALTAGSARALDLKRT